MLLGRLLLARGEWKSNVPLQISLGVCAGRSRFHAPGQRLARDCLDGMIPLTWMLGWLHSVAYVSALSLWALVSGHAWQAAHVEVEQERELKMARGHPLEERVVEAVIDQTELEPSA
jgi:hypothetical protein